VKGWKKINQANGPRKQAGVAILISDKVEIIFHTNKKGNTLKGNNNYQSVCTQRQCAQFHQTYSEEPKNIYRLQHSGSGRL
jgi:hypothetical protein